jgi:hypothetical protein
MEKGDPDVMDHKPRPKQEPIVHGPMRLGITVQTVVQTFSVLAAFSIGLLWHLGASPLAAGNPIMALIAYDWSGVDVQSAETMAFVTLSLASCSAPSPSARAHVHLQARLLQQQVSGGRGRAVAGAGAVHGLHPVPPADL